MAQKNDFSGNSSNRFSNVEYTSKGFIDREAEKKIYEASIKDIEDYYKKRTAKLKKENEKLRQQQRDDNRKLTQEEKNALAARNAELAKLEKTFEEEQKNLQAKAAKAALKATQEQLSNITFEEQKELTKRKKERVKAIQDEIEAEKIKFKTLKDSAVKANQALSEEDIRAHNNRLRNLKKQQKETQSQVTTEESKAEKLEAAKAQYQRSKKSATETLETKVSNLKEAADKVMSAALERNGGDLQAAKNDPLVKATNKQLAIAEAQLGTLKAVKDTLASEFKKLESNMSTYARYQGRIDARIQGSGKTYEDMAKLVTKNLAFNPFVQQTKMIENISKLSEAGIAYNLEERAFLSTISDKVATTFDATNTALTRLIKLQQADTSAERMGMEASLTQLLNRLYGDTSYLNNLSKSVSEGIIEANSQLSKGQAFQFEFTVQKWLGALSSAGMSESTVQNLARGINYLATGNVQAMTSDTGLNTLFALAAGNANLDYGKLFSESLDASKTNKLLEEIVKYLAERDKETKIVKGAYADILNMSVADMKAVTNVMNNIGAISGMNMTLSQGRSEIVNQIGQIASRTHISEMLENVVNNWEFATAADIASDPGQYILWKLTNLLSDTVGGIPIPAVSVAGFGVDLKTSVADIIKLSMVGLSTLSQVGDLFSALATGGMANLDAWGGKSSWSGGTSGSNVLTGTSIGAYVGSSSGSDIYKSSVAGQTEKAEESAEITNANVMQDEYTATDIYKKLFETRDTPIKVVLENAGEVMKVDLDSICQEAPLLWLRAHLPELLLASTARDTNKSEALETFLSRMNSIVTDSSTAIPVTNKAATQTVIDWGNRPQ